MAKNQKKILTSLRSRIILQMMLISLVPMAIMAIVVYVGLWNSQEFANKSVEESRFALQEKTVGANKAGLAWLLSYDMEKRIAEQIEIVRSWSRDKEIIAAAMGEDDNGEAHQFLGDMIIDKPDFEDAYIVNLSGEFMTEEIGYYQPDIESKTASWKFGKENGLFVSDLYLPKDRISPTYSMDIAITIKDMSTGDPLGVLICVMKIHPSSLGQEYEQKVLDHRIMVWDKNNQIITDTGNSDRYLQKNPNWTFAEKLVMEKITNDVALIDPGYTINDDVVVGYARASNESVTTWIPEFEGLGWTVMVEQDAKTAFAALESMETLQSDLNDNTRNALVLSAMIFAAVAVSMLGLAFWISRIFTRPILKLYRGVQEIMNGNLEHRVGSKEDDEIGQLARAFDEMTVTVKESQEELKDYSQNLEQKVQKRTDELQKELTERKRIEKQVKEQTAMLIQSEKMSSVGTMVAGVAHELNNPMTGIIQYTQFCLRRTEEDDRRYSVLKDIEQETRRCSDIVRNMLTFSRMEVEGEEGYQNEDIAALVDRVLQLLAYRCRSEHVTITQSFGNDMQRVPMKINSIQQVFLNLIGNAIDALDQNEEKVIQVEGQMNDGFMEVSIIDNGSGIPADTLKKIFDPFYTTKTVGKGTGLGLSISHSICKQHGGSLECDTEVGIGTKFKLKLPIEQNGDNQKEGD